ncbi:uncharacterized protein LOC110818421 [Carica papaya]|uniref:uncharacterized protein LOC110818421 n=1 Tax=Carica papaya TaxID=3649 RepID=UPI000B8D1B60|nr:uncharacterized protein LOC110818421 [Carica papaya]
MLPKFKSSSVNPSSDVGLLILIQTSHGKSNLVIQSALKSVQPTSQSTEFCYLKSCHLCNKKLSLDKEVYMYRGDRGFCSTECRNRQIVVDEVRELEISTKQMIASYRNCSGGGGGGGRETGSLLEDLHRQNKPPTHRNHWAIVS